jgi:4-diphosphocytidyl-2-C-methyl-D-erythritol kinase
MSPGAAPRGTGAGTVRLTAHAKINLHLQVLGRRPDGFHELRTLLQSIDLADTLEVAPTRRHGLELEVEPTGAAPGDETNLVLRAARALQEATGCRRGARLRLVKQVPAGAGLGGGSADAAAALVALDRLWGLGLDRIELMRLGTELGSDVPFFLVGGLALGVGRGDEVYPLPELSRLAVVIAMPEVPISTAAVYHRLREIREPAGGCGEDRGPLTWSPIAGSVYGFSAGLRSEAPWSELGNDLQPIVLEGWPELAGVLDALRSTGPLRAGVTGSGSALYAIFSTRAGAEAAASALDGRCRVHVGTTLDRASARLEPGAGAWRSGTA